MYVFRRGSRIVHTNVRSSTSFPDVALRAAADVSNRVPRIYEDKERQSTSEASGSLQAPSGSLVAAGNVSSGQRAIGGSEALLAPSSGG